MSGWLIGWLLVSCLLFVGCGCLPGVVFSIPCFCARCSRSFYYHFVAICWCSIHTFCAFSGAFVLVSSPLVAVFWLDSFCPGEEEGSFTSGLGGSGYRAFLGVIDCLDGVAWHWIKTDLRCCS